MSNTVSVRPLRLASIALTAVAAIPIVGCGLFPAPPEAAEPLSIIVTDRYQLLPGSASDSEAQLRVVPLEDDGLHTFQWWANGPDGRSANHLLDRLDGYAVRFAAGEQNGPYDIHCMTTNADGETYTAGIVLHVGGPVSLDVTTERFGVVAGGGAQGQVTVHLQPQSGTPPFHVTWTCTGPDGQVDNDRLDVTDPLSPVFTSSDLVGTYVLTARILDARGNESVQSIVVVVGQILGLDVISNRKAVLPGGGEDGIATLLATPIGGTAPYTYNWEIIDDTGTNRDELLWDRSVRSPVFESGDDTGTYIVRCAVTDGSGTVLIGSTTIDVGQQIGVDVTANRAALPAGAASGEVARLTADTIGGRNPIMLRWTVVGTDAETHDDLLNTTTGGEVIFTPAEEPGSYVIRCTATDADGVSDTDSVVMTVGGTLSVVTTTNRTSVAPNGVAPAGLAQLGAIVYGGTGPFTYEWVVVSPDGSAEQSRLNDVRLHDPVFTSSSTVGVYELICTVTDENGATAVDSTTIEVGRPLTVDVRTDRPTLLTGGGVSGQAQLFSFVTGGVSPYAYSWSVVSPGGTTDLTRLNDAIGANPVFTSDTTIGTYLLTLTVTDAIGATAAVMIELRVIEGVTSGQTLSLDVSTNRQVLAPSGDTATLSATVTGGVAPVSYEWSVTDPSGATDDARLDSTTAATVTFTSTTTQGTYRARCTVTDAAGNRFTDSLQLGVSDQFFMSLSADAVMVAAGDTITLTADRTGGNRNFTYAWSAKDESNAPTGTFGTGSTGVGAASQTSADDATNTWTAPSAGIGTIGTYRITVIATDAAGQNYIDSVMVTVTSSLAVDLTARRVSIAPGDTIELNAARTGGSGDLTYAWSCRSAADAPAGTFITGSTGAGTATQTVAGNAVNQWTSPPAGAGVTGTYRITVTVTDGNGQSATDSVMLVVANALVIDVSAARLSVQPGGTVDLSATHMGGTGSITYDWTCLDESGVAGGAFTTGATGPGNASQTVAGDAGNTWTAPAALGTYRILVTATDEGGASFTDSTELLVESPLTLTLVPDVSFVPAGTAITLSADRSGGEAGFDYAWSAVNGAGNLAGSFTTGSTGIGAAAQGNESDDVTNTWSASSEGSYVITCTVTDQAGQVATATTQIVLSNEQPFALEISAERLMLASGEVVNLTGNQTGGTSTFSYQWSALDESGASAGAFGSPLQNGVADDATNTWTAPTDGTGTYRLICTLTDARGRVITDSLLVYVSDAAIQNTFLAPIAATDNHVLGTTNLTLAAQGGAPGQSFNAGALTNPDFPRNIVFTISDNGPQTVTQGTIRVTGIDAQGRTATETLSFVPPAVATRVVTGTVCFAALTQVEMYGFTGVAIIPPLDTIRIGIGDKFGLTGTLSAASDVLYVSEDGEVLTAGFTIDAAAGQQGITFATLPDGSNNYTVVFRPR